MLTNLLIKNILLIEKLDIEFQSGLCVLTGETGAGKSILLDSLIFVLGARASSKLVRQGATQGMVTAVFDVSKNALVRTLLMEHGIELEDSVLLKRVIEQDGKSKTFINDTPVSLSFLKQVGENLIEFHGQHEQKGLLEAGSYLSILDSYGELLPHVKEVRDTFVKWRELERELVELQTSINNAALEEDYLRYVIKELHELNPQIGEEEQLASERATLMNKEKIIGSIQSALSELQGPHDVEKAISSAQRTLLKSTNFSAAVDALERANIELKEAIETLENNLKEISSENKDLDEVETRLFALRAASRKFNCQPDELPNHLEQLEKRLSSLTHHEENIAETKKKVEAQKQLYFTKANALSESRKATANKLEEAILKELKPLKMEKAIFKVQIEAVTENQISPNGIDKVMFLISTNPGMAPAPLGKIASGGELSRFMLATKLVLSKINSVTTIIFDEVDTGIGGATADAVGKRLALLSKSMQIIVVTHQPQVAAKADYHLLVRKEQKKQTTETIIEPLFGDKRKEEIARMLAGEEITDEAKAAATILLTAS
jgi:DNA repair protein RecN (Recombination protein N)